MLKRITIGTMAVVGMTGTAQAYLLIDDFTVGTFTSVLTGNQGHLEVSPGLDRSHSAFGWRQSSTQLLGNTNGATLTVSIGNGEQRFQADKLAKWDHSLGLGDNSTTVDFSAEAEFWVDYRTEGPANSFADFWSIRASDVNGIDASNDGPLGRSGGIYFRKSGFSRPLDWSHITSMSFTQNWNAFPNPLIYTVTKFYAVPEPAMSFLLPIVLLSWRRAKRHSPPIRF